MQPMIEGLEARRMFSISMNDMSVVVVSGGRRNDEIRVTHAPGDPGYVIFVLNHERLRVRRENLIGIFINGNRGSDRIRILERGEQINVPVTINGGYVMH